MHKPNKSLLSTKPKTSVSNIRTTVSFDTNSPMSGNQLPLSNIQSRRVKKPSQSKTDLNIQENYDPLPSFGDEVRYASVESPNAFPRADLNRDFQAEKLSKYRQIESHRSQRSEDFSSRLKSGNQASNVKNVVKDLKNSNSYLNAMRALQLKVKELQKQLELTRQQEEEIERRHQREVNLLTQRFDKERQSLLDLENNLKNRLGLLEDELKERERMIDNLNSENERLRTATQEVQTERNYEIERLLNDKGKVKGEYKELEERYEEKRRVEEELRMRIIQLECALGEKESFCKELTDKISSQEKEKVDMRAQFDQKLTDLVVKQKQAEEKNKELEIEYKQESKRRAYRDEEIEQEMSRLKLIIRDLEIQAEQAEIRCREKERELIEKAAQTLNLREEIEKITQEHEKTKSANDRTHFYAQGMANINQRLLNNIMSKSREGSLEREPGLFNQSQTPKHAFSVQFPQGIEDSVSLDFTSRRQLQSMRLGTMNSGEKSRGLGQPTVQGWALGSPSQRDNAIREGESYYQGPKLSGEDLTGSRGRSLSGKKERSAKKENKEAMMEKLQHEAVIKEIIEVERETLEWNKEYQRLTNDMIGLDRESIEYKGKKRRMDEISDKLQEKSAQLIRLKKKEEEITSRFRY